APCKATPMRWLLLPPLRPFVLLAAATSLGLNLALLMPSMYTLQVFDRVFASRSIETLVVLSALTVLALGFAYCMDIARSRALALAGIAPDGLLSPAETETGPARSVRSRRDAYDTRTFA